MKEVPTYYLTQTRIAREEHAAHARTHAESTRYRRLALKGLETEGSWTAFKEYQQTYLAKDREVEEHRRKALEADFRSQFSLD